MADQLRELVQGSLNEVIGEFAGPADTEELIGYVRDIVPLKEIEYNVTHVQGSKNRYKALIDCCLSSYQDVETFIEAYQNRSNETLRKVSPKRLSDKNIYKVCYYYRCQHKTQYQPTMNPEHIRSLKPSKRMKNTNCPFSLSIRIRHDHDNIETFKGRIDLEWNHNHTVEAAQALSFKDISSESKERITSMFNNGYTPSLAYREFLKGIRRQLADDLELHAYLADRSKVPSRRDFNNLYTEYKKNRYGSKNLTEMFSVLNMRIKELRKQHEDYTFKFQEFNEAEDQPFILAVVTPLMKRVHGQVYNLSKCFLSKF